MLDYTIYLIALSLAIDCFIVSIALVSAFPLSKKLFKVYDEIVEKMKKA